MYQKYNLNREILNMSSGECEIVRENEKCNNERNASPLLRFLHFRKKKYYKIMHHCAKIQKYIIALNSRGLQKRAEKILMRMRNELNP